MDFMFLLRFPNFCPVTIQWPGKAYDDGGKYAESGKVHEGLLSEMLQHPHYQRSELPISIGAEDFPRPLFDKQNIGKYSKK